MNDKKHNPESRGAKQRNRASPRHLYWKNAHRDWRVWCAVVLMIALTLVYVMTDNLALRPGEAVREPMPAASGP